MSYNDYTKVDFGPDSYENLSTSTGMVLVGWSTEKHSPISPVADLPNDVV